MVDMVKKVILVSFSAVILMSVLLVFWLYLPEIDCPRDAMLVVKRDSGGFLKRKEYCINDSGSKHGPLIEWFSFGKKNKVAHFDNGQRDGLYVLFYENGNKSIEAAYCHGVKDGKETRWWDNGHKKIEMYYQDGKLVDQNPKTPEGVKWACWDRDGRIVECPWLSE